MRISDWSSDVCSSDLVFGVLPNGMKYALLKNSTPKDSVVIRMRFDVGSFAEAEDQRGLAHFLEHMAFNGSTPVPEGELLKMLERKGLAFGADTNASPGSHRSFRPEARTVGQRSCSAWGSRGFTY